MKPSLIAFAGLIGAGKSYAATHLCARHGFTKLSFADPLREMLLKLDPVVWPEPFMSYAPDRLSGVLRDYGGWDMVKSSTWGKEIRRLLQVLGTDVVRKVQPNYWCMDMACRLGQTGWENSKKTLWKEKTASVVIDDCRFKNECNLVKQSGGKVIYITHVDAPTQCDRHSSESFDPSWADLILENDGTEKFLETVSDLLT